MESGKIFVGGLNHETKTEGLKRHFSSYGEVTDCVVMTHFEGKSRGFGFVTFADPDAVTAVLANQVHEIDGKVVDPKPCSMKSAHSGPPKSGRPNFTGRTTKIFIGGLPNDAQEDNLKSFFSSYGKVVDVVIMKDQTTQKPRGFGFLTFDNEQAVDKASDDHYITFNGKQIEIKKAEPRQGGGGGGGGGGGRRQNYNQEQGWGDGGYQNQQQNYGYQSGNSYGGYGNQGFDPNWNQSQNYNQQNWQGQAYQAPGGYNQQQYGGQNYTNQGGYSNGQSYTGGSTNYGSGPYGGFGAQGYNSTYGNSQGYTGGQGTQGYSGAQGYSSGSTDGYTGSSGGGKSSSTGGSQGYHPYKR